MISNNFKNTRMHFFAFWCLLFVSFEQTFSQQQNIGVQFARTTNCSNLSLNYRIGDRHALLMGMRIHINNADRRNIYAIRDNGFALKFHEHFGLLAEYNRKISINSKRGNLLFFTNLQYSYLRFYNTNSIAPNADFRNFPNSENDIYYTIYNVNSIERIHIAESIFGLGYRHQLFDKIFLTQKAGLGLAFYWSKNDYTKIDEPFLWFNSPNNYWFDQWETNFQFSIGLEYQIK